MTQLIPTSILGAISGVLIFLLGAVLRPFLTKYSEKKGENLATHEDISTLVDQVRAVTKATEDIKAEISTGLWDRQRRWDMKREVIFVAAKRLSEIDDALLSYSVLLKEDRQMQQVWKSRVVTSHEEKLTWAETKHARLQKWTVASTNFDETRVFLTVVCSMETAELFHDLGAFINKLASQMLGDPNTYDRERLELFKKILAAQKAMRRELDVEDQIEPQPTPESQAR